MLNRLFTRRRLKLYPLAILLGAALGFGVFFATSQGLRTVRGGRIGGDFPAFYGAALLVREGSADKLYDRRSQKRVQAPFLPDIEGGWIEFAYPPYVALAYVPFTFVGFKAAYLLHTFLMVACVIGSVRLLSICFPVIRGSFASVVAGTLTFYPLFRAVIGGQNTAASLLCASAAAAALVRGWHVTAGLCIGAWLFKPQLALTVGCMIALAGYPRVLIGIVLGAATCYLTGAAMAGPGWPVWWWYDGVVPFVAADVIVDRGNGVSFVETATELGVPALGWLAAGLTAAMAVALVWRSRPHPGALVGMATAAAVLCAPHALYYDGGLAVLGLAASGSVPGQTRVLPLVAAWVLGSAQMARGFLPVPPVTVVLVGSLVVAAQALRHARRGEGFEAPRAGLPR